VSGETILIVGSGDGATAAGAVLEGAPYRVLREPHGARALAALGLEPVRVVVAEWDMPGLDGIGLSRAVGDRPDLAAPPFILVTDRSGGAQRVVQALEAGITFVTVPFEPIELLARVEAELREVALRADQTRLQALVANVPGAIYRCAHDADYTMELISDHIERICGYPPSDFIQSACRSFASIIHPEDRPEVERAVDAAVDDERPFALEYRSCARTARRAGCWSAVSSCAGRMGDAGWTGSSSTSPSADMRRRSCVSATPSGRGWRSCAPRGPGSSTRATPPAGASSATCTTGRSSDW